MRLLFITITSVGNCSYSCTDFLKTLWNILHNVHAAFILLSAFSPLKNNVVVILRLHSCIYLNQTSSFIRWTELLQSCRWTTILCFLTSIGNPNPNPNITDTTPQGDLAGATAAVTPYTTSTAFTTPKNTGKNYIDNNTKNDLDERAI